MALIARTCMGKPIPSVVLGDGVAVAVRAERGDLPVGEERSRRRVQAGLRPAGVPRLELGLAPRVTRADEQDVAGSDRHALLALRRLEVSREHVLARLEPGDAAHARHVEQDAAADQPVLEDVDRTRL